MNDTSRTSRRPARPGGRPRRRPAGGEGSPRLRSRLRAVARETILDAAEEVFAQHGTTGGRMEEVAVRAGVSVGTLYNHFRDRRALLDALVGERRTRMLAAVDAALDRPGLDFHARLGAFAAALWAHQRTHRGFSAVLVREGLAGLERPGAPSMNELRQRAATLVRAGQRAGALRRGSVDDLTESLLALIRAGLKRELDDSGKRPRGSGAPWWIQLFLEGAERR